MTASMIEVDTVALASDTTAIRGEIRALWRETEDLRGVAAALDRMWEGEAKEAFLVGHLRELSRLEEAIRALEQFLGQTEDAGAEYERCARAVEDVVAAIRT